MEEYDYVGIARQIYQLEDARYLLWDVCLCLENNYCDGVPLGDLRPDEYDKGINYMKAWAKDLRNYIERIEKALIDLRRTGTPSNQANNR